MDVTEWHLLTFNATILSVEQLKRSGFVEREFYKQRSGMERKRIMMVTQAIANVLDSTEPPFPRYEAGVSMDTFRAGYFVTVSREAEPHADFKLLQDVDEVWAFSIRKPRDFQARLFGRFVHKDVFVATRMFLRAELGSQSTYHALATDMAAQWLQDTGGVLPLRSNEIDEYLSSPFRDLDKDE